MELEIFLLKTVKRLRKEAPRRFKELRTACDHLIELLSDHLKNEEEEKEDEDADKYFEILQNACETRQPKLMEIALDAMKFLIDHAYLRGNKRIPQTTPKPVDSDGETKSERRILIDLVMETVARCADEYDDSVHAQVISVFVAAITSSVCQVHEASLILAVGSCINIHLVTRNQANKTQSKAALIQILSVVFFRMETFDARAKMETEAALAALGKSVENEPEGALQNGPSVPCGEAMYPEVYGCLGYKPSGGAPTPFAGFDSAVATIGHIFPSILHKDAFLIFRALCKLSMKSVQDDGTDPYALPNKVLALELILHILEHSGPAFKSGDKFIFAIRQYLCVSLLNNCTSQVAKVAGLSLYVFVALLNGFKDQLKAEIEVFITNIFLRLLESENSSFDHKSKVLEVFQTICKDHDGLIELFLNYDCDLEGMDLFRRIVDAFGKIAKNPTLNYSRNVDFMSRKISTEEISIRLMGLEGLVIILRSLLTAGGPIFAAGKGVNPTGDSIKRSSLISYNQVLPSLITEDLPEPDPQGSPTPSSARIDDGADESKDGQGLMMRHDRKQKIQEEIETGILKFNLSPKKGLAYLASLGHLEMTPLGVANFLHQYGDKLDKTAIGDYLGREAEYENGFCAKVLHEYVGKLDFTNLHFDAAIRLYLSGFRLPGEAQKIDRIMEKFAEKYYLQNRDVFASADMAFILAFSTIMLQTNLHTPAIRDDQRMTKEQFVRQNTGISSDGELPEHMLLEIYDRIQANPIVLDQDLKLKKPKHDATAFFISSQNKRRQDAFNDERKEMVRASEAIFKQKKTKNRSKFVRSHGDAAYIRPMFEVAWAPMIGVFSQILEMSDDFETTSLCLEGFQAAIRIACRLDVNTARDTYVNSLAKFTTLESIKEMKSKHLDAIKMLINVALNDGDYLFESWGQILRCVSHLSRLQLFGSGLHSDDMFFSELPAPQSSLPVRGLNRRISKRSIAEATSHVLPTANGLDPFKLFTTPSRAETSRIIEESNAELVIREIDPVLIDRIFLNSHNLSTESVLHFITNLCQVSIEEISTTSHVIGSPKGKGEVIHQDVSSTPRVFSLQKLVEVADFNMHSRPRIAWAKLWSVLANHFTTVGVHENRALAMYAIDSLKQLSIKFLLKSELSNFNFQRLFLKPFEVIMSKSPTAEIKELILRCLDIMILACANNIRSGWRSIFSVFSAAAGHEKEDIAGIAFEITERLVTQQFDLLIYDFIELMNCLIAFVAGSHTQISLSALSHISLCSDHLAAGTILPALNAQHPSSDTLNISWDKSKTDEIGSTDAEIFRLWWPVLLGLSTRVADHRVIVRTRALEVLHRVLKEYGHLFSTDIWGVIFRGVLFPMIDSTKLDNTLQPQSQWPTQHPSPSKDPFSWIGTTSASVLAVYISLFNQYYFSLTHPFLPDLLALIEGIVDQGVESLSKIGVNALRELIMKIPVDPVTKLLSSEVATRIAHCLCGISLRQLFINFEDVGCLELDLRVPSAIKELIASQQLSRRLKRSSSTSEADANRNLLVKTPYGVGKVKYSEYDNGIAKRAIVLSWGAMLYTTDVSMTTITPVDEPTDPNLSRLTRDQAWSRFSSTLMCSMVLSLELIKLLGDTFHTHYNSWSQEHLIELLSTMQCFFDHGRCFNAHLPLRTELKARNFMRFRDNPQRLPHLLDQVTQACSQLMTASFRLFKEEEGAGEGGMSQKSSLAESIIKRISNEMIGLFLDVDESSLATTDPFIIEELQAYVPPVIVTFKGLADITPSQFQRYISWLVPLLSRSVLCQERTVRFVVMLVYESQVNPLLTNK